MRIEVLVESEEPRIYSLKKPQIYLGSHDSADIIVSAAGISRRHLLISSEGDYYYVTDQGSSNGTFINEERLVPGRRTEFTSFFPVRLGADVLITLLSDEDAHDLGFSDLTAGLGKERTSPDIKINNRDDLDQATRAISLKDLRGPRTESLVKKRQEALSKRKEVAKKDPPKIKNKEKERTSIIQFVAVILIGGAIYYNFFLKEKEIKSLPEEAPVAKVGEVAPVQPAEPIKETFALVPESELSVKESFTSLLQDFRCSLELEKALCEVLGLSDPWGVVLVGTSLDVLIDGTSYFHDARAIIEGRDIFTPPTTQEEIAEHNDRIHRLGVLIFVLTKVPPNLNEQVLAEYKINFAFFTNDLNTQTPTIQVVAAFVPKTLKQFRARIKPEDVALVKRKGMEALDFSRAYYRIY